MSAFQGSSDSFSHDLKDKNFFIIKVGTNSIMQGADINRAFLTELVYEVAMLAKDGKKVVIVTSGAVGLGKRKLSFASSKNLSIVEQQGLAAIGQMALMKEYMTRFDSLGVECAQVLISQHDFKNESCRANIKNTFAFLMENNVVAIVNENDVVATEELKQNGVFSDNDALAALLAKQLNADLLVMLTSKNGLIGKDGAVLKLFESKNQLLKMKKNSNDGRGGIDSKLESIEKAISCGCDIFVSGQDCFKGFSEGKSAGTYIAAKRRY